MNPLLIFGSDMTSCHPLESLLVCVAGGYGGPFRSGGYSYVGYGSYECQAPSLRYLPLVLPPISLIGGQVTVKPLLISNDFGDASWGGYVATPTPGSNIPLLRQRTGCSSGNPHPGAA